MGPSLLLPGLVIGLWGALSTPSAPTEKGAPADGSAPVAAFSPASTVPPFLETRELQVARARIAELEAELAGLKATPAETVAVATPTPPLDRGGSDGSAGFDPDDDDFRFLELGVRRSYIGAERERLLDQIHTMIPPLYEPAFSPFHGYTLPRRAIRIGITVDRFTNDNDFGRDEFYERFFNSVKVENQHVDVDVAYGLDHNDTLRLIVPLRSTIISGTGQAFRIEPMVMTMNGTGYGLGDVQLVLKRKWFDQAYRRFNFATVFGVQFPTGKNDSRFDDAQTLLMSGTPMPVSASTGGPSVNLFSDDLRIPNGSQPGTGSWGLIAGAMGTRQFTWNRSRGALHAGFLYKAMRDTSEGVRPGNELAFSVSYSRPPLKADYLTFDITLFGRNKQSERFPGLITHPEADENGMPILNPDGTIKMFTTARPPFEHGTVVFLSPSLVLIPKPSVRLTLSPVVRVYEPEKGPSPAFRLLLGATTTF